MLHRTCRIIRIRSCKTLLGPAFDKMRLADVEHAHRPITDEDHAKEVGGCVVYRHVDLALHKIILYCLIGESKSFESRPPSMAQTAEMTTGSEVSGFEIIEAVNLKLLFLHDYVHMHSCSFSSDR